MALAEGVAVASRTLAAVVVISIALGLPASAAGSAGEVGVLEDLHLAEPVAGDAVVFGADLYLEPGAEIAGDAIAVGGSVTVSPRASVRGHVVAVFGRVDVDADATVSGRVLGYASLASLASDAAGHQGPLPHNLSVRLLAAGGWLLVTTGLAFLFPSRFRCATWAACALGPRLVAAGLLIGLTVVAAVIAALGLGPALGVPLVAAVMVLSFAAKAAGLTVLGAWIGGAVARLQVHHPLQITVEVFVGMLVLLALRFVPIIGEPVWMLVSLTALGASIVVAGISPAAARAEA